MSQLSSISRCTFFMLAILVSSCRADPDKEARVLLNWSGVGAAKLSSVVNKHDSGKHGLEGDFAKAHAFQLTEIPADLFTEKGAAPSDWRTLPIKDEVLSDALRLAVGMRDSDSVDWIPKQADLSSPRYRAHFHEVTFYSTHCEYVLVFIIDTEKKILYALEHKI